VEDRQGGYRRPSRTCGTRLCHRKLDFGGAVSAVRSVRSRSLRVRRFAGHGTFIVLAHYCNSSFNMDSTVEEIPPFSLKPWKTQGRRFSAPLFGAPPAGHMPTKPTNSYLLQNVKLRRSYVFRKGAYGMDETENGVVGFATGRSASRERLNMVWRLGGAAPAAGVWAQRVSLTLSNIRSAPRLKRSPTVAQVRKFPGSRLVCDLTNNSAMAGIETQPKFHRRSDN